MTNSRVGETVLLSMFGEGNVVLLKSASTGKNLRIMNGSEVNGNGGEGKKAQFIVHVRGPGKVALQSSFNQGQWLAIFQGCTIGTGCGGPHCELYVREIDTSHVVLESVMHPGQRVGILPNGCVKPPENTYLGLHAQFTPSVLSYGFKQCTTQTTPPAAYQDPPPPYNYPPPPSQGTTYPPSTYPPSTYPPPPSTYPPPPSQGTTYPPPPSTYPPPPSTYPPPPSTYPPPPSTYPPPPSTYPPPGTTYPPPPSTYPPPPSQGTTYTPPPGSTTTPYTSPPSQGTTTPTYTPHPNVVTTPPQQNKAVAGNGPVLCLFAEGNRVTLQSHASRMNLRILNGCVEGRGGAGRHAQFIVHVHGPAMVSLQSVFNGAEYIAIRGNSTTIGWGGKFCRFYVREFEGRYAVLESVESPGQRVGILPSGDVKAPVNTGTGPHARFIPLVL